MSTDQPHAPGAGHHAGRGTARYRWLPLAWCVYGAAYVVVFAVRAQPGVAAACAVVVALIGVGLWRERRQPASADPRMIGWEQDERQRAVYQQAAAVTGYVALFGTAVAGFVLFAADSPAQVWPMTALFVLFAVYAATAAFLARRG